MDNPGEMDAADADKPIPIPIPNPGGQLIPKAMNPEDNNVDALLPWDFECFKIADSDSGKVRAIVSSVKHFVRTEPPFYHNGTMRILPVVGCKHPDRITSTIDSALSGVGVFTEAVYDIDPNLLNPKLPKQIADGRIIQHIECWRDRILAQNRKGLLCFFGHDKDFVDVIDSLHRENIKSPGRFRMVLIYKTKKDTNRTLWRLKWSRRITLLYTKAVYDRHLLHSAVPPTMIPPPADGNDGGGGGGGNNNDDNGGNGGGGNGGVRVNDGGGVHGFRFITGGGFAFDGAQFMGPADLNNKQGGTVLWICAAFDEFFDDFFSRHPSPPQQVGSMLDLEAVSKFVEYWGSDFELQEESI